MEKITKIDENFNLEEHLKWVKDFLGINGNQSFQDLDIDISDDEDEETDDDERYTENV